jgi:hypothetical protein
MVVGLVVCGDEWPADHNPPFQSSLTDVRERSVSGFRTDGHGLPSDVDCFPGVPETALIALNEAIRAVVDIAAFAG